jgi:hypothetical protein
MPPPYHYKLLLLYGGSHDVITFKHSAYFGAPFCVLNQTFLIISCFYASSFASVLIMCIFIA